MAPPSGSKRKRVDRTWSGDSSHDGQRPSPHRPGSLNLAQQAQGQNSSYARDTQEGRGRGYGGRRPSRSGRGGLQAQNSMNSSNSVSSPDQRPLSPATTAVGNHTDSTKTAEVAIASPKPLAPNSSTPDLQHQQTWLDYDYLTDEVCAAWDATGRQATLEIGIKAKEQGDGLTLSSLFQELVQAALSGRLPASKAGELIKDTIGEGDVAMLDDATTSFGPSIPQATFLDALSIVTDASSGLPSTSLQSLVFSTGISPDILRQELEASLLESLGLIRSTFARMGIRKQTNILYRQANFNLMREESEGFAKLMTELFTTSNNEPPTSEVVEETVERVKAMIGAFDLDVGRTLDVVLDVFGAVLVKQFRFFVKFLRASPWWPRDGLSDQGADESQHLGGLPQWALPSSSAWYLNDDQKDEVARQRKDRDRQFWIRARAIGIRAFYELGRQRVPDEERSRPTSESDPQPTSDEDLSKDWIQRTGTLPPQGNRDAAQLLGFKLRFYSSSDARTEHDVLPENLIYLSALLVKVGFISLKDLYPHIWRTDECMEELRKEKFKEKAERERAARPGASAKNALLMAGALADDTLPIPPRLRESGTRASTPAKDAEAEQTKPASKDPKSLLPEPIDQKVLLLQSLLAIGALPDALFILGRFPWLLEIYPELTEYLHRIIHHSLSHVYASVRPLPSRSTLQEQRPSSESDIPGLPKGHVKLVEAPPRKTLRWALLDRDDTGLDGLDYRFYWDDWSDIIPVCQSVDDAFTLFDTFLNLSGVKIGQDTPLLSKLARIGKYSLANDRSEANRSRWFDMCKRLLIPALSFTKSNAGVVNEVFEVLNAFPLDMRYTIYLEWSAGQISRSPDMKFVFEQAKAETRDVLKRISKTNLRPMARALAKVAYANPHIVITTALNQIEVYDSIADTFVEGARYFTDLGYDILTWALISSMARAGRSRVQEGGIFTSKWLAALASFTGKIFRRYNFMKPGPVLQYVADQLAKGNSRDLVVLEQVILSMAGITTDTSYNDAQIQAMGGGELLQSQTILQLHDRRHESRLTSKRLMRSLRETGLTGKLLLSLAQRRQACVFDTESEGINLKVLGNTFDELHRVMVQYLDLLRSNLSLEELRSTTPDVVQLLLEYGLSPEVAFWISRPIIAQQMVEADKEDLKKRGEGDVAKELTNGDIEMADQANGAAEEDGEAIETESVPDNAATPTAAEISGTTLNSEVSDMQAPSPQAEGSVASPTWHPVLQEIMDAIRPKLPQEVIDIVGVGFYVTFWQLSLYDITIPSKSYEDELSQQHKKMAAISADRTDISVAGTRRKEAEKKNISELVDRLLKENKDHLKAFAESKARLQREKYQWFAGMSRKYEQLNSALMEYCFLPRILNSPLDSFFCFKFAKLLHSSGTPNFRTLGFYDLIFRQERLTSLIFSCTSKEADNLGRFMNEILRDLARWHKEKTLYEREAYGSKRTLPGFTMQLDSDGKPVTFLVYEDYRRILYRWHCVLFSALQTCLSSAEYMHIRNAISVLRSILQHFPAINFHGTALLKTITSLSTSDKADIVVSSKALIGTLTRQEKSWVLPASFRKGQDKPVNGEKAGSHDSTAAQAEPDAPKAPKSEDPKPPTPDVDENKDSQAKSRKGAEDGEVADTEMSDASRKPSESSGAVGSTDLDGERGNGLSSTKSDVESKGELPPKPAAETPSVSDGKSLPAEITTSDSTATLSTKPNAAASKPEDIPKASTTQPASIPKRPDSQRTTPSASNTRPSPNLPNKPERPDMRSLRPDSRFPPRPALQGDTSREPRDMRSQDYGRRGDLPERSHQGSLDRPGGYGPRGQDHPGSDRQPSDRGDLHRGSERNYPTRNIADDRLGRPPPRDHGPPMWDPERSARARPAAESQRGKQGEERVSSERGMALPGSQTRPQSDGVVVNPERAALINGGLSIRGQGEERSSRTSRPPSPKRNEDRRPPPRSERPDNDQPAPDRVPGRHNQGPRHRMDDSGPPSSRDQRLDRPSSSSNDYSREPRHQQAQQATVDMNHGRLNQDSHYPTRQQDSPSDRPTPASDIPSGPRSRSSLSGPRGRNPPPPPPHVNTQQAPQPNLASASNPSGRQTPTGPSARSHMRNNSYHEQSSTAQMATPTTSADTTGVHPDRLGRIQPLPSDSNPPRPAPFSAKPPPPSPTQASPPSVPSGPRGNAPSGAPSGPSPTTRGPPSGPQFANDGSMRGSRSNRHPLAAVNNTLAQAGQGTSIRGRGGMRNSGPPTPHSGPSTPISGPGQEVRSEAAIPPQQSNGRPDLFTNRGESNGAVPSSSQPYGQRPSGQRQPSHRDDVPPSRPPPGGRRGDLIDESSHAGRSSSRHSGGRNDTPDRDGGRRSERDDSHRDRDAQRSDRDHGRDRERDRDREPGRDRRGEGGERHRETSSRRDDESAVPARRSGRGRETGPDIPPLQPPPPPPPPMHGQDERRGAGPGAGQAQGPRRGDGRRHNDREDTGRSGRGGGGGRDDDMPPRKHSRGDEGAPYGSGGGGRGGGGRMASESKRPRRGL